MYLISFNIVYLELQRTKEMEGFRELKIYFFEKSVLNITEVFKLSARQHHEILYITVLKLLRNSFLSK